MLALAGAGGLFGAALAGRVAARFGTARGFLLCEAFAAPMLLLGPVGDGLVLFTVAGFCAGAGIVASNILTSTFRSSTARLSCSGGSPRAPRRSTTAPSPWAGCSAACSASRSGSGRPCG
ncbi:hypothetical protein [Nonomuraea rubra]|uniref:hypothetical protein n=1 Tax=Nonomuraea rubra TaxID=46180 RepID=UPI0031EE50B3